VAQRISSLWPDGTLIMAVSWHDLEEQVRARQWHKYSVGQFRREMRRRALLWSNTHVSVKSAEALFRGLESAGMVRLDVSEDEEGGDADAGPG
jgi:hypothetical protein